MNHLFTLNDNYFRINGHHYCIDRKAKINPGDSIVWFSGKEILIGGYSGVSEPNKNDLKIIYSTNPHTKATPLVFLQSKAKQIISFEVEMEERFEEDTTKDYMAGKGQPCITWHEPKLNAAGQVVAVNVKYK